jgi:hypothetical protein
MPRTRHPVASAILWGGLVAGTVDIGAASLITGFGPLLVLKFIAGGLLGKAAMAGGPSVAALGLLLQWAMSIVIAAIFVLAMRRRLAHLASWPLWGAAYGVVVFAVMNYVVLPLSALHAGPHFSAFSFIANLAAMLLFGWIVAFVARIFLSSSAPAQT